MKPANSSSATPPNYLAGKTVLVTRAAGQSADLVQRIEAVGGRAIVHPVIEIRPAEDLAALDGAISGLGQFDMLVFTSRNGVQFFKDRMDVSQSSLPPHIQIAAIGSSTAQLVHDLWQVKSAVPASSDSSSLAKFLIDEFRDQKMLLIRGDRGSDVLGQQLSKQLVDFESVVAYRSVDTTDVPPWLVEMFELGQIGWVTATSSAIGKSAVNLFSNWLVRKGSDGAGEDLGNEHRHAKLVSISPTTSAAIESVGGNVDAEATEFNLDGLVAAMKSS